MQSRSEAYVSAEEDQEEEPLRHLRARGDGDGPWTVNVGPETTRSVINLWAPNSAAFSSGVTSEECIAPSYGGSVADTREQIYESCTLSLSYMVKLMTQASWQTFIMSLLSCKQD